MPPERTGATRPSGIRIGGLVGRAEYAEIVGSVGTKRRQTFEAPAKDQPRMVGGESPACRRTLSARLISCVVLGSVSKLVGCTAHWAHAEQQPDAGAAQQCRSTTERRAQNRGARKPQFVGTAVTACCLLSLVFCSPRGRGVGSRGEQRLVSTAYAARHSRRLPPLIGPFQNCLFPREPSHFRWSWNLKIVGTVS